MGIYEDKDYTKNFKDSPCPFVRNGECEVPPCNSCFIESCKSQNRNAEEFRKGDG